MTTDRYDELCAAHRWDVPGEFNIAEACCTRWANDRARFALYWEDESGATAACTFWDLQQRANRLSNALVALGVRPGDKVALILPIVTAGMLARGACGSGTPSQVEAVAIGVFASPGVRRDGLVDDLPGLDKDGKYSPSSRTQLAGQWTGNPTKPALAPPTASPRRSN